MDLVSAEDIVTCLSQEAPPHLCHLKSNQGTLLDDRTDIQNAKWQASQSLTGEARLLGALRKILVPTRDIKKTLAVQHI